MPDPSRKHSTNQPGTRADRWPAAFIQFGPTSLALSLAPGGLSARHGVHRPPGPRAGQTARPGNRKGKTMTEATMSFAGNLTDDPKLRHTEGGIARAVFQVAVSGRRDQEASFFTVIVWRDQADHAAESLSKGSRVVVLGRFQQRTWTAEDGSARSTVRCWPMSWAPACGGRLHAQVGRPGRAEPGRPAGPSPPSSAASGAVLNVTSRRCPRSPTDLFTAPGLSATLAPASHPQSSGSGARRALRWISATLSSSSLR
jgi:single-strand DNA-binding protein